MHDFLRTGKDFGCEVRNMQSPAFFDGHHLTLKKSEFRETVVSKDSNDTKGQSDNEPPGEWATRTSLVFRGLASVAM